MHAIIHQNKATVASIRQRDFSRALESSALALKLLQQHMQDTPTAPAGTSGTQAETSTHDCLDQCMLLSKLDEESSNTHDDQANNTAAFVYDHGILLPPVATEQTTVSAVVIFNAALAHQLYAQQTDKDTSQRYLLASRRLYESAHGVHRPQTSRSPLFRFVVINNMAVIDKQTGNLEQSTRYFNNLLMVLMVLVDEGCTSRLRHLHGFLRNALPSSTMQTAVAA